MGRMKTRSPHRRFQEAVKTHGNATQSHTQKARQIEKELSIVGGLLTLLAFKRNLIGRHR